MRLYCRGKRAARRTASGKGAQLSRHHLASLNTREMQAHAAGVEGQHSQHCDLIGERLGVGDADFGAGVQIDAAVGLTRNTTADDIAQAAKVGCPLRFDAQQQRPRQRSAVSPDWVATTIVLRSIGGLR